MTFACNCQYGSQDARCCINRARRQELEEAHRLGREGKPLPEDDTPVGDISWLAAIANGINGATTK